MDNKIVDNDDDFVVVRIALVTQHHKSIWKPLIQGGDKPSGQSAFTATAIMVARECLVDVVAPQ